ncbi:MAG TPA: PLP-dependent aminotransferase family protein [Thermoanaerobaculia bacterium]|nr:PLP-dependent aminotransferase family protein [Thermoanaerobaculia bacterium]
MIDVQDAGTKRTALREPRLSRAVLGMGSSGLREVMEIASRPGVLSFAVGLPATDLFPREALAAGTAHALRTEPAALQYTLPLRELKEEIVRIMALRGVRCRPEQVFLTSGAQQAMDLLSHLLLDPGGQVVLEEAIYDGIRIAVRRFEPRILTVPTSGDCGIDVDAVAALLSGGARPAFLYLIPESHNPLGASLPLESRQRLAQLARDYRMPLLEDDTYGLLGDAERTLPALRAFEEDWVYYIGSFAKILAPALRVGWTVVPESLIPRLSMLKHAADVDTASIGHRAVAAYLAAGHLPGHLETLRREYRRRRDAMLAALAAHMPAGTRWNRPEAGFYLWVELPRSWDATALLRVAAESEQVAFAPGEAFAATDAASIRHCLRLSFGNCSPERIEEGARRLGRALSRFTPAA